LLENDMQDDQYLIDRELSAATLECLDPTWDEAELVIDLSGGGAKVSLAPVDGNGFAMPSDEVYVAVGKLRKLHKDEATDLQRAVYTFRRRPDGKWSFAADFAYLP
jgi:hypothetical protein